MDEVGICNMALMRVGVTSTIANLNEESTESIACNTFYEQVRDSVLRDFPWGFATKRAVLGLLSEDAPTNWSYSYELPSDCLRVREIVSGDRVARVDDRIPYEVGSRKLFTDQTDAELLYTYRVEDVALFDPLTISAIAWGLACELGVALGKPEMTQQARQMFQMARHEAYVACLSEGHDNPPESEFITVRN